MDNEGSFLVSEYIMRLRLAKIGFQSNLSDLPGWKAEGFCLISSEIDRLQAEELKKHKAKNSRSK